MIFAALDLSVAAWIASVRTFAGVRFFTFVTSFGKPFAATLLLCVLLGVWWAQNKRAQSYALAFAVAGSMLSSTVLKLLVARARPDYALFAESTYSFPSSHSVIAVSFFAYAGFLMARGYESPRARFLVRFFALFLSGLIAFSRLYLGVHFATDVLAGGLLGLGWVVVANVLLRKKFFGSDTKERAGSGSK